MAAADTMWDAPVRVIEPRSGWIPIGWRELWEYRELLGFLVWRDVKVRYKQTVLGATWAILQPLLSMAVFTVPFGRWAKMPSDGLPYPLFAFAALLPWTFFSNAIAAASSSLVGNTHLISKVYFPRLLVAFASLGTGVLDLAVALIVMFAMMAGYGVPPTARLLALPLLVLLTLATASGVGAGVAALCAIYRDFRYVVPFALQFWMFASPVIYPTTMVPARWRPLLYLNPLVGIIDGFRASLLGQPFDLPALAASTVVTLVVGWFGLRYFRRVERRVADLL